MSQRNNLVAAVDIGTNTTICLIGMMSDDNKLKIASHSVVASSGVRRGIILNIEDTVKAVKHAVDMACDKIDTSVSRLYVNVAGHQLHTIEKTLTKTIPNGKIVSRVDVVELFDQAKNTTLPEGEKVYHVVNQSYSVDGEVGVHNPIGYDGSELQADYRLIVGPENYQQKVEMALQMAGFEMVKCIVNPVAAAEAVLTDDEKEAGVVVVDMGGGTTSVSIYFESVLRHLAVIPFGGNVVTNDIKEGCSILLRQAESLKVKFGAAWGETAPENKVVTIPGINGWEAKEISFRSLAYIIQARMEEIIEAVYFQIEKSGFDDKLGAGIVLTGGGASLNDLKMLTKFKAGMNVRIGYPVLGISSKEEKQFENPLYATSYGLLKRAFNDENALNDDPVVKRKKKERPKINFGEAVVQRLALFFNEEQDAEF